MINFKLIGKIIGSLLFIEAAFMTVCLALAIFYREDDVFGFLVAIITTLLAAFVLRYYGRNASNLLNRRDAYLVVTLSWVMFSLFGTLPFTVSGFVTNFTDAYFENMSGFTTTGASVIDDVEALPHGLLFWRSLTQWVGGLGIMFFTIALLPSLVGGSVKVFSAEATGPLKTKMHPRLSTNAKWIWMVYIIITVLCVVCLCLAGMDLFNSINYAMSVAATGGFATQNTSAMNRPAVEYVIMFFCFVSGINFTVLYITAVKKKLGHLLKNEEFKFYALLVILFIAFIMVELVWRNNYGIEKAFRCAAFQVISFITTTGLVNDDAGQWPHVTWVVLAVCMFFGACSGSTSGGIKCVRGVMLTKVIANEFKQILHPNAVLPLRVDKTNVSMQKRVTLLAFLSIYLVLCLFCSFVMIAEGVDNTNAITITLSSMGNVGPTLGLEIGPTMSWSILSPLAKWICTLLMLIGRLEIFTVLVIFTPAFWKSN